jgi:predicted nucleotidyltransferase component of viral defense system
VFRSGLGEPPNKLAKAQIIELDLAFGGDPVTPAPRALTTPFVIGEGHLSWSVYPIETVIAEKLHALLSRAERNSRAKDLYDVFVFLPKASAESLAKALTATFAHRQTSLSSPLSQALKDVDKTFLRLAWDNAVVSAVDSPPSFEEALASILDRLDAWSL